jgi:ubiquinone/menaquinone biosynthesis C-methylase UbiE
MYKTINPLEKLIKNAEEYIIINDRMLYEDILFRIEEYSFKNGYVIHSKSLLFENPISREDFVYTIFFTGGYLKAYEFADYLYGAKVPHIPINTLSLTTPIRNRTFTILVNQRVILNLLNIDENIVSKISCIRKGFFTQEINCSNALIHLCGLYEKMYNYMAYKEWERELEYEKKLYKLLFEDNDKSNFEDNRKDNREDDKAEVKDGGNDFVPIAKMISLLLKNINELKGILVGDFANEGNEKGRIQVITAVPIDELIKIISKIVNYEEKFSIKYTKNTFAFDSRLVKYVVKIGVFDKKYDLLDVYNNCAYQAMPYDIMSLNGVNIKIGSPFVRLRYLIIQYYITTVILGGNGEKQKNDYINLRNDVWNIINTEKEIDKTLFTKERLFGENILEKIWNRQFMTEQIPIYYPAIVAREREKTGSNDTIKEPQPRIAGAVVWYNKVHNKIASKITRDHRKDIKVILNSFYGANKNMWASSYKRNDTRFDNILRYCYKNIDTYLDIGSGDGIDFKFIKERLSAKKGITADVKNYLLVDLADNESFLEIGVNVPLDIKDASVDVITMLHSLHHAVDAMFRLRDIARILKPCGILIIKDHDIVNKEDAENVSFEHFVYSVGEAAATIEDAENYQSIVPMYYYSHKDIRQFVLSLGFSEKLYEPYNNSTKVYYSVFQKYDEYAKECLFKGEASVDYNAI